jgi:excisionase family DNA binding protein
MPAPISTLTGLISTQRKKLTAGQVAELFGVRVETVRRWSDDGKLRCTRTLGGDRRYDAAYIDQLLREQ